MPNEAAKLDQAQLVQRFAAPVYDVYYPVDLWNEILPGLHLGGTDTSDDMNSGHFGSSFGNAETQVNKDNFDTVVTLYAWARPADWFVKELRFGIMDSDMSDFNLEDLRALVQTAHTDWKAGRRVLIRCQAGINRSSLVMALVLIRDGLSAKKAIELMRQKRGQAVLSNPHFVDWLSQLDVRKWRT
jgi:predicted protein tyrosine phosphatase